MSSKTGTVSADPTRINISADPQSRRMTGMTAHGFIPFDAPFISEITVNLWQGGCKNGLVLPKFIRHLVSLYPWESYTVRHELDSSLSVRMLDATDQDMGAVDEIARWVAARRKTGPVAIHCQAGLNRSSLVTARVLMLDGATAGEAIRFIREKRSPACLCNPAFEEWLLGQDRIPAVSNLPAAFGASLRRLRAERGWSQRGLAARAGVSSVTVSNVERGGGASLHTAIALAGALDASLDAMTTLDGEAVSAT